MDCQWSMNIKMTKNITINWVFNDTPQVYAYLVFNETEFISSRFSESKLIIHLSFHFDV